MKGGHELERRSLHEIERRSLHEIEPRFGGRFHCPYACAGRNFLGFFLIFKTEECLVSYFLVHLEDKITI